MRVQSGRPALPIIPAVCAALFAVAASAAEPSLLIGPSALEFAAPDPATQPARQTVFVASSGAPLSYAVKTGYRNAAGDWLSINAAAGVTPAQLTVSAN